MQLLAMGRKFKLFHDNVRHKCWGKVVNFVAIPCSRHRRHHCHHHHHHHHQCLHVLSYYFIIYYPPLCLEKGTVWYDLCMFVHWCMYGCLYVCVSVFWWAYVCTYVCMHVYACIWLYLPSCIIPEISYFRATFLHN